MFRKGGRSPNPVGKGNTIAIKHSLYHYQRMLSGRIDARTTLYKVLHQKERELIAALGGDPSPQERTLIADAVKNMLYIGTLDEYLMSLDGGIVRNYRVIPAMETRTQLAAHLRRDLEALGLKRVEKSLSLDEIKAEILAENEDKP